MVLYTKNAMYTGYGNPGQTLRSHSQIQTDIVEAYASTNDAFLDSGIDVTVNVVHMQLVRISHTYLPTCTSRSFIGKGGVLNTTERRSTVSLLI